MERPLFEAGYYETYYFANIVRNVIHDRFSYLRKLDDFYGDSKYLSFIHPFPRYSVFHSFIEFVIDDIIWEQIDDINIEKRQAIQRNFSSIPSAITDLKLALLPINLAFDYYKIEHNSFEKWLSEHGKTFQDAIPDDVSEYYCEIRMEESYEKLLTRSVSEVFFVLFQNRRLLLLFNEMMANQVTETNIDWLDFEVSQHFSSSGVLKRVNISKWVQRAVYFRDRGLCVTCHRDLSGIISIGNIENYDHMVPLAKGGLNDVSNIQLLCRDCNQQKRHHYSSTSDYYESWYSIDEK